MLSPKDSSYKFPPDTQGGDSAAFEVFCSLFTDDEIQRFKLMRDENEFRTLLRQQNPQGFIGWLNSGWDDEIHQEDVASSTVTQIVRVPTYVWGPNYVEELEEYVDLSDSRREKLLAGSSLTEEEEEAWDELQDDLASSVCAIDVFHLPNEVETFSLEVSITDGTYSETLLKVGPVKSADLVGRLIAYLVQSWDAWTDEFVEQEHEKKDWLQAIYRHMPADRKRAF